MRLPALERSLALRFPAARVGEAAIPWALYMFIRVLKRPLAQADAGGRQCNGDLVQQRQCRPALLWQECGDALLILIMKTAQELDG